MWHYTEHSKGRWQSRDGAGQDSATSRPGQGIARDRGRAGAGSGAGAGREKGRSGGRAGFPSAAVPPDAAFGLCDKEMHVAFFFLSAGESAARASRLLCAVPGSSAAVGQEMETVWN